LKPYIVPVFRLVNETYRSLFGFDEMNEDEMHELARKYLPMLDPEFTKVITDQDNNPIAFVVASPNISKGIRKAKENYFHLDLSIFFLQQNILINWIFSLGP
jgi:hypothetical protein